MFEKMSFDINDLLLIYFKNNLFHAADLELSMVTNIMASGELIISELSYVVAIIELYLFWSTIIIKITFHKKDRKEYGRCAAHLGC